MERKGGGLICIRYVTVKGGSKPVFGGVGGCEKLKKYAV